MVIKTQIRSTPPPSSAPAPPPPIPLIQIKPVNGKNCLRPTALIIPRLLINNSRATLLSVLGIRIFTILFRIGQFNCKTREKSLTVCPRSHDQICIVSYYIKWVYFLDIQYQFIIYHTHIKSVNIDNINLAYSTKYSQVVINKFYNLFYREK